MRYIIFFLLTTILGGCFAANVGKMSTTHSSNVVKVDSSNPVVRANEYLNYSEQENRQELKTLTGVDPMRTEWCAAFVNAVLEESGIKSNKDHRYPLTARAYLDWGIEVNKQDVQPGNIVVFPRGNQGWQGHVGFFLRHVEVNGVEYYAILGGNQSNKVSIQLYRTSSALGIRRYSE